MLAAATVEDGYEVTRSQTVVPVPHGKIGRKTIDRESRVGVTEDTDGNSTSVTMTLGGFMDRCPTPEAGSPVRFVVPGDFEYSLVGETVNTDAVPTERRHYEKRMTARITVFVNDDLSVSEGEIDGQFTSDIDGVRTGPVQLRKRFPIRAYGVPDFDALRDAVAVTGDMAAAALMWNASTPILEAQRIWREANECAEFEFDPASETRAVSPGETVEVRVRYRTRDGRQPIPKGVWDAEAVQGGRVTESRGEVEADGSFSVNYVARSGSTPKAGDGMRVKALSGAGFALELWKIRADAKFEGTFSYSDVGEIGTTRDSLKVTGTLTWTPEDGASPSSPTFGDVKSSFYKPTAGQFVVEKTFRSEAIGGPGNCSGSDRRTFTLEQLAPGALRFMTLEIAEDGRYRLILAIPDRPDPFPRWEFESICTFPSTTTRQREQVRDVAVALGKQEGRLNSDQDVIGQLAAPIRRGPRVINGSWSFKKPRQ